MSDIDVDALTEELAEREYVQWQERHAGGIPKKAWDGLGLRIKQSRGNQIRGIVEFVAARVEQDARRRDEAHDFEVAAQTLMGAVAFLDDLESAEVVTELAIRFENEAAALARGGSDVG